MRSGQIGSPNTSLSLVRAPSIENTSPIQTSPRDLSEIITKLPVDLKGRDLVKRLVTLFPKVAQRYQAIRLLRNDDQQFDILKYDDSLRSYLGISVSLNPIKTTLSSDKIAEALIWAIPLLESTTRKRAIQRIKTALSKNTSPEQTTAAFSQLAESFPTLDIELQRLLKSSLLSDERIKPLPLEIRQKFQQVRNRRRSQSEGGAPFANKGDATSTHVVDESEATASFSSRSSSPSTPSPQSINSPITPRWTSHESSFLHENKLTSSQSSQILQTVKASRDKIINEGGTMLHVAASLHFTRDELLELISTGSSLNARDNNGKTPLELALTSDSPNLAETVALLRAAGADVELLDVDGNTLLHRQVVATNLSGIDALLKNGSNPNARNTVTTSSILTYAQSPETAANLKEDQSWLRGKLDSATPLHLAAAFVNDPAVIRLLVAKGAHVNASATDQSTALHWATMRAQRPEVIEALLENGADIDAKNDTGLTALASGARHLAPTQNIHVLIENGASVGTRDRQNKTPIEQAVETNDIASIEIIKALLAEGADLEAPDANGNTLLHRQVMAGHLHAVRILLENGAKVSPYNQCIATDAKEYLPAADQDMFPTQLDRHTIHYLGSATPLHLASAFGSDPKIIKLLVKHGAKAPDKNINGITPLHYAAVFSRHPAIVYALTQTGTDIDHHDVHGHTPLHLGAKYSNSPAVIRFLIKAGASVHARDAEQFTPLHLAAIESTQPLIIYSLIASGADVNAQGSQKRTPLHLATAWNKNSKMIEALRMNGASTSLLQENGQTALDLALQRTGPHAYDNLMAVKSDVSDLLSKNGHKVKRRNSGRLSPVLGKAVHSEEQQISLDHDMAYAIHLQESQNDHLAFASSESGGDSAIEIHAPHDWEFASKNKLPNLAAFNTFQRKLLDTAEYKDPRTRTAFIAKVNKLVEAMKSHYIFRYECFDIAADALEHCGDRIAVGLYQMECKRIDFDATRGKLSTDELLKSGERQFKLDCVLKIAGRKISELKRIREQRIQKGPPIDEIEVNLAYQTDLAQRLDLPAVPSTMLYRRTAKVSPAEITAAYTEVMEKIEKSDLIDFLVQWSPWRAHLQRKFSKEYLPVINAYDKAREALSVPPSSHMTDHEYGVQTKALPANENWLLRTIDESLTREAITALRDKEEIS